MQAPGHEDGLPQDGGAQDQGRLPEEGQQPEEGPRQMGAATDQRILQHAALFPADGQGQQRPEPQQRRRRTDQDRLHGAAPRRRRAEHRGPGAEEEQQVEGDAVKKAQADLLRAGPVAGGAEEEHQGDGGQQQPRAARQEEGPAVARKEAVLAVGVEIAVGGNQGVGHGQGHGVRAAGSLKEILPGAAAGDVLRGLIFEEQLIAAEQPDVGVGILRGVFLLQDVFEDLRAPVVVEVKNLHGQVPALLLAEVGVVEVHGVV